MAIKSSDQISLVDLTDGFSVILTNDSYTFPGTTNAAKAGSTTTTIVAMCGADQIPAAVDNSKIIAPTGVTTSVDTDATQPTVTISVTTAVKTGGTVDIPVSLDSGITAAKVGDMYLNTDTMNTYRCTVAGAASAAKWVYIGNIKGATGETGAGAIWYTGTKITGTSTTATIFSGSGITNAKVGDMYLNTSTYNTYRCTVAGAAAAAKWVYVNNIKGAKGDQGNAGADAITMTVTSSNGTIFKNTAITTTLTAHVYKAGAELDATAIAALGTIKWYKDGSTTALSTTGQTLNIGAGDIEKRMAVKAKAEITLASIRDVKSTTRYYLLQSSTASKPSKPSANPPGGSWVKTEPPYTAGSTNSLYFTDLTVFSDDTYVYSDVSLSSSYEAAKAAYNKAVAAEGTARNTS